MHRERSAVIHAVTVMVFTDFKVLMRYVLVSHKGRLKAVLNVRADGSTL